MHALQESVHPLTECLTAAFLIEKPVSPITSITFQNLKLKILRIERGNHTHFMRLGKATRSCLKREDFFLGTHAIACLVKSIRETTTLPIRTSQIQDDLTFNALTNEEQQFNREKLNLFNVVPASWITPGADPKTVIYNSEHPLEETFIPWMKRNTSVLYPSLAHTLESEFLSVVNLDSKKECKTYDPLKALTGSIKVLFEHASNTGQGDNFQGSKIRKISLRTETRLLKAEFYGTAVTKCIRLDPETTSYIHRQCQAESYIDAEHIVSIFNHVFQAENQIQQSLNLNLPLEVIQEVVKSRLLLLSSVPSNCEPILDVFLTSEIKPQSYNPLTICTPTRLKIEQFEFLMHFALQFLHIALTPSTPLSEPVDINKEDSI